jgi:single-stranded-DNA-specific exonuclease
VRYAKKCGIDIVVTDHHEITKEIPSLINVNCKRGRYPNPFLSGVGVAYKLAQAVAGELLELSPAQWESAKRELLILVLFGSTADRVPLLGENRTFAALGRSVLPRSRRMAVEVLKEKGVIRAESGSIGDVVPILSSARSSDGYNVGCELLTTTDHDRAVEILTQLRELSRQWYAESRRLYEKIRRRADPTAKLIIVVDPTVSSYHLGYCANRLKEEFFKPSIVLSVKDGCYVGEGRSINTFNLVELLTHCKALLLDYGGHTQAAGFSIAEKDVSAFVERATHYADSSIDWSHLVRKIMIDSEIAPSDLTPEVRKDLKLFRPFGEGNREPVFLVRGVTLKEIYADHIEVERDGMRLSLRTSFSKGKWVSLSGQPIRIDCVISVSPERMPYLVDSRPSFMGAD